MNSTTNTPRWYGAWLFTMLVMVFLILLVGGITRLTESGLSIVEWHFFGGLLPPFTAKEWNRLFELYQQTEQYRQLNQHFALADFQKIFWWEYSHRFLARALGFILALGMGYLLLLAGLRKFYRFGVKTNNSKLLPPLRNSDWVWLWLLLLLGGIQGFIGRWMVASGLFTATSVGAPNLMVHFMFAFVIMFVLYARLALAPNRKSPLTFRLQPFLFFLFLMVFCTMALGSLTAGARAGYSYGTWPLMGDSFIPKDYWWRGHDDGNWQNNSNAGNELAPDSANPDSSLAINPELNHTQPAPILDDSQKRNELLGDNSDETINPSEESNTESNAEPNAELGPNDPAITAPVMPNYRWLNDFSEPLNFWQNALFNPSAIQFHHRLGAYLSFCLAFLYAYYYSNKARKQKTALNGAAGDRDIDFIKYQQLTGEVVFLLVAIQLTLGVLLVIHVVPFGLAMLHQWLGSILLLTLWVRQFVPIKNLG